MPLSQAGIALGLGLTNECNLSCSFCYRDPDRIDRLSLEQVRHILDSVPVRCVNLGTGENGMHPEFRKILGFLASRSVQITITSNGHSTAVLTDDELRLFHDVEFSLDYPTREEQDRQRGAGNWDLVREQSDRCRRLGVPVTTVAVMMRSNYDRMADVARVAGGPLRINVYQSVRSDIFALTYEEYWTGFRKLFEQTRVVFIGEPLVRALAGLPPFPSGAARCGTSTVRVTPRATVQPCVYWPSGQPLTMLTPAISDSPDFVETRTVPGLCQPCEFRDVCGGGCAGRRRLMGSIGAPDPYCPIQRGDRPRLEVQMAPSRDMPKTGSACTTIVEAM